MALKEILHCVYTESYPMFNSTNLVVFVLTLNSCIQRLTIICWIEQIHDISNIIESLWPEKRERESPKINMILM